MAVGPELLEELAGRFEIERKIGGGTFGQVLLARDLELSRRVALKVLHWRGARSDEAAARFDREARLTARIRHPGVVEVYDHGTTPSGARFIVYEWVEGEDLAQRIRREGPRPAAEVVRLGHELAAALAALHEAGVLHRDLKPANVLLRDGSPVLVDLGLAFDGESKGGLTETGAIIGTLCYMAPETWAGERASEGSDVFSLAAVLHEVREGRPLLTRQAMARMLDPRAGEPHLEGLRADALGAVMARALRRDPADRLTSAAEFARALASVEDCPEEAVLGDETAMFDAIPVAEPGWRRPAASLLLVGALLAGGAAWHASREAAAPPAPPPVTRAPEDDAAALQAARSAAVEAGYRAVTEGIPGYEVPVAAAMTATYEALREPTVAFRWKRLLRAVDPWVLGGGPEVRTWLQGSLVPELDRVLFQLERLHRELPGDPGLVAELAGEDSPTDLLETIRRIREDLHGEVARWIEEGELPRDPDLLSLRVALLVRMDPGPAGRRVLARVVEVLEDPPADVDGFWLLFRALDTAGRVLDTEHLECLLRLGLEDAAWRNEARTGGEPSEGRLHLRAARLPALFSIGLLCPEDRHDEVNARLDDLVDHLVDDVAAYPAAAPGIVGPRLARCAELRRAFFLLTESPALKATAERIEALADRLGGG